MCKFWKTFLLLIQGLERKKSIQKEGSLGRQRSPGPELFRGESERLWRMGMRPVLHVLVHVVNEYSLRAYYMPGTVHTGKAAMSKIDKNPCPRGMHIFVLFPKKVKSVGQFPTVLAKAPTDPSSPFSIPVLFPLLKTRQDQPPRSKCRRSRVGWGAQGSSSPEQRSAGVASPALCCVPSTQNSACTEPACNQHLLNKFYSWGLRSIIEIPEKNH